MRRSPALWTRRNCRRLKRYSSNARPRRSPLSPFDGCARNFTTHSRPEPALGARSQRRAAAANQIPPKARFHLIDALNARSVRDQPRLFSPPARRGKGRFGGLRSRSGPPLKPVRRTDHELNVSKCAADQASPFRLRPTSECGHRRGGRLRCRAERMALVVATVAGLRTTTRSNCRRSRRRRGWPLT
jgi:hypothetical protein